jgi:hypothetical protein
MEKTIINIQTTTILGNSYNKIYLSPVLYTLNSTEVSVNYEFQNSTGDSILRGKVVVTPISNWGTDDSVVVSAVLTALGLTAA